MPAVNIVLKKGFLNPIPDFLGNTFLINNPNLSLQFNDCVAIAKVYFHYRII